MVRFLGWLDTCCHWILFSIHSVLFHRQQIQNTTVKMTVIEICIYVSFFHFVYQHDNSEWLKKILDTKCIQKRNKTNAITFFGQFCSFLFELIYWILVLLAFVVGRKEGFLWASASFLRFISFSTMAAIDVLISNSLRPKLFESFRKLLNRLPKMKKT